VGFEVVSPSALFLFSSHTFKLPVKTTVQSCELLARRSSDACGLDEMNRMGLLVTLIQVSWRQPSMLRIGRQPEP
jgi:hypothetical protein